MFVRLSVRTISCNITRRIAEIAVYHMRVYICFLSRTRLKFLEHLDVTGRVWTRRSVLIKLQCTHHLEGNDHH